MLSSFREATVSARAALLAGAVSSLLSAAAWSAVDAYVIPEFDVRAEHHTNVDLRPDDSTDTRKESVNSYGGLLGATLGMRSPRGKTEIHPLVEYQDYPDRDELTDTNLYFDLKSVYEFQRDSFAVVGHYTRLNEVNAEIPEAGFDNFDPQDPTDASASAIRLEALTISRMQLRPEYVHRLSERLGVGASALFQTVKFDSDSGDTKPDNKYGQLQGFLAWTLDQRTTLQTGLYASQFETDDDSNTTKGKGVIVNLERVWTPAFSGFVTLNGERTDVEAPGQKDLSSNSWGFTVGGTRSSQVGRTQLSAGRTLSPSFSGSRVTLDEIRLQYDRSLSERLSVSSAGRTYRSRSEGFVDSEDSDFARADLEIRYALTPTWYVAGGYSYIWQKFRVDDRDGNDNVFGIHMGYVGLPPQK